MLINFVLFQVGWFACVLGAAKGWYWLGPVTALLVLSVYYYQVHKLSKAVALTVAVALAGGLSDGVLAACGVLVFESGGWFAGPLPVWMLALWGMFATTLDRSMRWLQRRLLLAGVLGAVLGPVAYAGAERLGAVQLGENAYGWLALEWGVLMIGCSWLALRWTDQMDPVLEQNS